MTNWGVLGMVAISLVAGSEAVAATPLPAESARMARAKDLISDDQWAAAKAAPWRCQAPKAAPPRARRRTWSTVL